MTSRYSSSPRRWTITSSTNVPCGIKQSRILRLSDRQPRGVVHGDVLDRGKRSGPASRMSPMWLTSKMPTPVRTAMCSLMMPQPIDAGYSTGMSQPLNSTIFAPIWRWTAFSAVLRMAGASTEDNLNLNQRAVAGCRDGVTDYRITRFFSGSNAKSFTTVEGQIFVFRAKRGIGCSSARESLPTISRFLAAKKSGSPE